MLWLLLLLLTVVGGALAFGVAGSRLPTDDDPPVASATVPPTTLVADVEMLDYSALCVGFQTAARTFLDTVPEMDMTDPAMRAASDTYTATVQRLADRAFESEHLRGWQLATFFAEHLEATSVQWHNWNSFVAGETTEAALYESSAIESARAVASAEEIVDRCALWAIELEQP